MAKSEARNKARQLRQMGWKISTIAQQLDIPPDTVSRWCADIALTEDQVAKLSTTDERWIAQHAGAAANKRKAYEARRAYQQIGRQQARTTESLRHLMGCMLYWGEGSKRRDYVNFTNTDPHMIRLFYRFLVEDLNISRSSIKIKIKSHGNDSSPEIKCYWQNWLKLTDDSTIVVQQKEGTRSRKSRYPNGICTIEVYQVAAVQQIFGAIQEYTGFDREDWLR